MSAGGCSGLDFRIVPGKTTGAMWFYSIDGAQQGPVSEDRFNELVARGEVPANALVWREGMAGWEPLSAVRPQAGSPPPIPAGGGDKCSSCGGWFGRDDLISLSGMRICGGCKPAVLQRLREGVPVAVAGNVWRHNKDVVTLDGTELPCRCMKCNEPTNSAPLKRKVSWHPPAYYLIILIALLIYVIVALIVRKQATVSVHLCDLHRKRRMVLIGGCWGAVLLGLALVLAAISSSSGEVGLVGVLLLIGGGIVGAIFGNLVKPTKIDGTTLRFRGAGAAFLDSLPEWPNS